MKVNSNYLKTCLFAYFRFSKRCYIMATEVGRFNSDFLAIGNNQLIECEIKTSREDLNADFKKDKHIKYSLSGMAKNTDYIPNYFYFCVPKDLVEHAVAKCVGTSYGVLLVEDSNRRYMDRIRVVKKANKIHNNPVSEDVKININARQASETANLRIKLLKGEIE